MSMDEQETDRAAPGSERLHCESRNREAQNREALWVQRNHRRKETARPAARWAAKVAESVLAGALDPKMVAKVLDTTGPEFGRRCRLLVREDRVVEVYVDTAAGVGLMRRQWAGPLSEVLRRCCGIRQVVFRHGVSGSRLQPAGEGDAGWGEAER